MQPETAMAALWGPSLVHLERCLDLLAARQRVVASNIANADTPGYRAREIDFRSELESFAAQSSPTSFYPALLVREKWGQGAKNDGNNVDLDHELESLSENALRFSLASSMLQKQIQELRNAIREGK